MKKEFPSGSIIRNSFSGYFLDRWDSIEEAAKNFKIKPDNILKNLEGKNKTCNGCLWEWE